MRPVKILLVALLISQAAIAQPPDTSFTYSSFDTTDVIPFDSLRQLVFGGLNTSRMQHQLLYDVVPTPTRLPYMHGLPSDTPSFLGDYINALMEYNLANLWGQPEIDVAGTYALAEQNFLEENTIPLGIFYYSFDRIRSDAFTNNQLRVGANGKSLEDVPGSSGSPYEPMVGFILSPVLDEVENTSFNFKLDSRFVFTNHDLSGITSIEADFGDGMGYRTISMDVAYPVDYLSTGTKELRFIINFSGGARLYSTSRLHLPDVTAGAKGFVDRHVTDYLPDEIRPICISYEAPGVSGTACGEYGIWLGCGNNRLRKPLIISSGFDPFNLKRLLFSLRGAPLFDTYNGVDLNNNNNGNNLLVRLRQEGYDIIILDFYNGWDYIQANGSLLRKLIIDINQEVSNNGSKHEAIVAGWSAGALNGRYALSLMEFQHQSNPGSYPGHHTWRYVSFDGEHQGANVPLGLQNYTQYVFFFGFPSMLNPLATVPVMVGYPSFMNPTAYQSLIYHVNGSSTTTALPNPLKAGLFNYMNTLRPSTGGYPSLTRNISVSQGSSNGLDRTSCCFSAGANLLHVKRYTVVNLFPGTQVRTLMDYYALGSSGPIFRVANAIKYTWFSSWNTTSVYDRYANGSLSVDNAPASTTTFHRNTVKPPFLFNVGPFMQVNYIAADEGFAPTISTLDVRNGAVNNAGNITQPLLLNTKNLLFWNANVPNGTPFISNTTGYPHLGFANPDLYTPFDAVYADFNVNNPHVNNPSLGTGNFVFSEVAPYNLKLQNRTIGATESYRAAFEARTSIESGSNVTWTTEYNPYTVASLGDVDFRAGQFILLQPGFSTDLGAVFYAYIQPYPCEPKNFGAENHTPDLPYDELSQQPDKELQEQPTPVKGDFYPNPGPGLYQLLLDYQDQVKGVDVIDMTGRKVQLFAWNTITGMLSLNLTDHPNGIYTVTVYLQNGDIFTRKLVKQ